jgi:hypothetical protein
MSSKLASLTWSRPQIWKGRYARIPGDRTTFHVHFLDHEWWPFVDWAVGDEIGHCRMVESSAARALAQAVNSGKRLLGAQPGGAFLINEYGQVLVPGPLGYLRVAAVGEWEGPLEFWNEFDGGTFDLTAADLLNAGDPWHLPYLGIPHQLSFRDEIYFWKEDAYGGMKILPPLQDDDLIDALRMLRRSGPVRFLAAYRGLVLTKVPVGPRRAQTWEACYVGRLDYKRWYSKEV